MLSQMEAARAEEKEAKAVEKLAKAERKLLKEEGAAAGGGKAKKAKAQ